MRTSADAINRNRRRSVADGGVRQGWGQRVKDMEHLLRMVTRGALQTVPVGSCEPGSRGEWAVRSALSSRHQLESIAGLLCACARNDRDADVGAPCTGALLAVNCSSTARALHFR